MFLEAMEYFNSAHEINEEMMFQKYGIKEYEDIQHEYTIKNI